MIVNVQNLSQAYSNRVVLRGINLQINEGEILTLLGPNGAGKTTLLKVICGLLKPLKGMVQFVNGHQASFHAPSCSLYRDFTLNENLQFFKRLYGTKNSVYDEMIDSFGLHGILSQTVSQLSYGQKLRGDLCRTFMQDVDLYLLDEVLTGLDQKTVERVLSLVGQQCSKGKSVLMTTHTADLVSSITKRWINIDEGQITWDDTHLFKK